MLEASLATDVVDQCLATPDYTPKIIVRDNKEPLLKRDYELLLISPMCHPSVNSAAQSVSRRKVSAVVRRYPHAQYSRAEAICVRLWRRYGNLVSLSGALAATLLPLPTLLIQMISF